MCGIGACEFVLGNSNDNDALALLEHVRGAHAVVVVLSRTEVVSVTSLIAEHLDAQDPLDAAAAGKPPTEEDSIYRAKTHDLI